MGLGPFAGCIAGIDRERNQTGRNRVSRDHVPREKSVLNWQGPCMMLWPALT